MQATLDNKSKLLHPDASVSPTASCQSGSFCLTSSWAERETYERSRKLKMGWDSWGNAMMSVSHAVTLDGVTFLSSSHYVDDPLKSHFPQRAKTVLFFFLLARTINSQRTILLPRDPYWCCVETTFWVFFLSTSLSCLGLRHQCLGTIIATLHCLYFPIDDTEPFCLFTSWTQWPLVCHPVPPPHSPTWCVCSLIHWSRNVQKT